MVFRPPPGWEQPPAPPDVPAQGEAGGSFLRAFPGTEAAFAAVDPFLAAAVPPAPRAVAYPDGANESQPAASGGVAGYAAAGLIPGEPLADLSHAAVYAGSQLEVNPSSPTVLTPPGTASATGVPQPFGSPATLPLVSPPGAESPPRRGVPRLLVIALVTSLVALIVAGGIGYWLVRQAAPRDVAAPTNSPSAPVRTKKIPGSSTAVTSSAVKRSDLDLVRPGKGRSLVLPSLSVSAPPTTHPSGGAGPAPSEPPPAPTTSSRSIP